MPIETKKVPTLVISAEVEPEGIEPGFYLGPARPSVEKPHLQIHPVLFSDGSQTIGFLVRTSEEVEIGQCTGKDVRDYQEAEGVLLDPFSRDYFLNEKDPVLVVEQGSQKIFIMRPDLRSCYARRYDSHAKKAMIIFIAYRYFSESPYGFTIESDPSEGLALSADSYIDLSSY